VWLDQYLCKAGRCATTTAGLFLYIDEGHLSYDGRCISAWHLHFLSKSYFKLTSLICRRPKYIGQYATVMTRPK